MLHNRYKDKELKLTYIDNKEIENVVKLPETVNKKWLDSIIEESLNILNPSNIKELSKKISPKDIDIVFDNEYAPHKNSLTEKELKIIEEMFSNEQG